MEIVIRILTMIIMVAATLRTILQAVETLRSLPIPDVLITLAKFLATLDWL